MDGIHSKVEMDLIQEATDQTHSSAPLDFFANINFHENCHFWLQPFFFKQYIYI